MVTSIPVLLNTLLYAGVGIVVFILGFFILDMLTPGKLWEEINDKQNRAVATFAGAAAIALAIIIGAAIHG
jgi:putative membrane protein